MIPTWILLVLLAQFAWALGNFIDKWLITRYDSKDDDSSDGVGNLLLFSAFFNIVVAACIVVIGMTLSFMGQEVQHPLSFTFKNILIALSVGMLEVLWLIPYFYALRMSDEVSAPPLFQTIPIFGFLLGFFVFNEVPIMMHIAAGSIILLGSIILNVELTKEDLEAEQKRLSINWKVIALMLLSSSLVALAAFFFKETSLETSYFGTAFWMGIGAFFAGVLIWLVVPTYRTQFNSLITSGDTRGILANVGNEIIDNTGILLFYAAILTGPSVALVQATVAYQPICILLIGLVSAHVLGSTSHQEKLSGGHLLMRTLGISVIVLGSILIFY